MRRVDDMPAGKTRTDVCGSVSDRLAAAAAGALVGRAEERARLTALLSSDGPAVVLKCPGSPAPCQPAPA